MEPEEHGDIVVLTADEVANHGAHATGMPQLDPTIWPNLIFWLVVSFALLYFILSRVALPRLGAILAERQDAISNDLEMAALLRRRAEEAEAAYDKALADAREEANRIAEATRAEMNEELKALMAKAEAEIAARSAESEARIKEIRDGAAQSIEEVARDTAITIVEMLMPSLADRAAVDAAVERQLRG
ncbi:MAG TPA: F0F1 ATP synthase subunit B' [Paracoccaceae bacterium]|nr:F0F1 ATP synthase subunit B' [Paracoccaceae bacterium]